MFVISKLSQTFPSFVLSDKHPRTRYSPYLHRPINRFLELNPQVVV
jgi:hypothetical protein